MNIGDPKHINVKISKPNFFMITTSICSESKKGLTQQYCFMQFFFLFLVNDATHLFFEITIKNPSRNLESTDRIFPEVPNTIRYSNDSGIPR